MTNIVGHRICAQRRCVCSIYTCTIKKYSNWSYVVWVFCLIWKIEVVLPDQKNGCLGFHFRKHYLPSMECESCPSENKEAFGRLASMAHSRGFKLYRLRPKFHLGCHIVLDLECGGEHSINPVCCLDWWWKICFPKHGFKEFHLSPQWSSDLWSYSMYCCQYRQN